VEAVTLLVASIGVVVVLASTAINGLIAFAAILLVYPDYLRVSIGSVDISACRIVVTILLLRCIADPAIMRRFQWKPLDSLVLASMCIFAFTLMFTTDIMDVLENRAGFLMDTLFVYLAVRFIIVDRPSFVVFAKAVSLITIFLAVHAVVETLTGKSLYVGLGQYCPYADTKGMEYQTRFGLNRAMGPPGETILFGLSFASLVPIIWMLRHEPLPWGKWAYPLTFLAICGVAATISSGPYLALIVVIGCLSLEYAKSLVKPLIVVFIILCMVVEVISNRHFYHVLADFTMDPDSGWYRARLIDVAIEQLPHYWTCGYGFVDPGWGPLINELPRTDAVNDYVVHAMTYGIFGLLAYLAVLVRSIYDVVRCYAATTSPWVKSCCWALASSLLGLLFAIWSVSMFGQMTSQLYLIIGLHGALAVHGTARVTTPQPSAVRGGISPLMPYPKSSYLQGRT
jgi:hypothetical protein